MNTQTKVKTPEQAKQDLWASGMTVTQWARDHNYTQREVSMVLNGQYKGKSGKAHDIAVALGIKAKPQQEAA